MVRVQLAVRPVLRARLWGGTEVGSGRRGERVALSDAKTGEVRRVVASQYLFQNYFSCPGNDMAMQGSIVDAVFSVLLANGNQPMTISEIAERVQRPSELLMKTFGGSQIYHGIRPLFDEE